MSQPAIITLTSDFGPDSPYVAQMKASILTIARSATIVDVTHSIPPQDIRGGQIVLLDVANRFPRGTIHVAVIDPGVGTNRRVVAIEAGDQIYVGPDNGLLWPLVERAGSATAVHLTNDRCWLPDVSATFHGRDVMAPVAAHLANAVPLRDTGTAIDSASLVASPLPQPECTTGRIVGSVIDVDRFGNLITNITRKQLTAAGLSSDMVIRCGRCVLDSISRAYGHHAPGTVLALLDSQGRLEIAVTNGSACRQLNATRDAVVIVERC